MLSSYMTILALFYHSEIYAVYEAIGGDTWKKRTLQRNIQKQRKCMWNYSQGKKGKIFQAICFRHNLENILID